MQFREDYIMIKLLKRNRIEEELGKSVKIFGKTISVKYKQGIQGSTPVICDIELI